MTTVQQHTGYLYQPLWWTVIGTVWTLAVGAVFVRSFRIGDVYYWQGAEISRQGDLVLAHLYHLRSNGGCVQFMALSRRWFWGSGYYSGSPVVAGYGSVAWIGRFDLAGFWYARRSPDEWTLAIPYWTLLLPFWVLHAMIVLRRYTRRYRREAYGLCVNCGYDLRASPHCCPECGTERKG
jgi:hypothetical protein